MIFNKHSHTHTYIWCFGTSVSFPVAIISRIACCLHLINSVGQRVSEEKRAAQLPATAFCNTLRSSSFCLLHREAIPFLQKPFARNSTAFSDTYGSKDNRRHPHKIRNHTRISNHPFSTKSLSKVTASEWGRVSFWCRYHWHNVKLTLTVTFSGLSTGCLTLWTEL